MNPLRWSCLVGLVWLVSLTARVQGGVMPAQVTEVVRQLEEWRSLSVGWLEVAQQAYPTNDYELVRLKMNYIEAQAIANSLIGKLLLETAARTPLDFANYKLTLNRAQASTKELVDEGKRLLMATVPKTRGAAAADDPGKLILENAQKSIAVAGGLIDMFSKNRRAFLELDGKQRDEIRKILETKKWDPLEKVAPRKLVADPPKASAPAKSSTDAAAPAAR